MGKNQNIITALRKRIKKIVQLVKADKQSVPHSALYVMSLMCPEAESSTRSDGSTDRHRLI